MTAKRTRIGLRYATLAALSLVMLLPTYWMLATALTSRGKEFSYPPQLFPHPIVWSNFENALANCFASRLQ